MNFSKVREKALFIKTSKILLVLFALVFFFEHAKYAAKIVWHIHTNHYDIPRIFTPQPEPTGQVENRLKQIREMKLKPVVVAYMGDSTLNKGDMLTRDYFLAQYTLAPLLLDHRAEHDTAVCDFSFSLNTKHPMNPLADDDRWTTISDNGKGALLLIKKKNF